MKRFISTALAVFLLLGLALMAVLARPNDPAQVASVHAESSVIAQAANPEFEVLAAPAAATNKTNEIALPLYVTDTITNALGLANYVGSGVVQVLRWNGSTQNYSYYNPPTGPGTNFNLTTGGVYRLVVTATVPLTLTFVGGVPPKSTEPGHVQFNLTRGTPCKLNTISIPLDRGDTITNATSLAAAIGGVDQVLRWNASTGNYTFYNIPSGPGTNFAVKIGYPYRVCLNPSAPAVWP